MKLISLKFFQPVNKTVTFTGSLMKVAFFGGYL